MFIYNHENFSTIDISTVLLKLLMEDLNRVKTT